MFLRLTAVVLEADSRPRTASMLSRNKSVLNNAYTLAVRANMLLNCSCRSQASEQAWYPRHICNVLPWKKTVLVLK